MVAMGQKSSGKANCARVAVFGGQECAERHHVMAKYVGVVNAFDEANCVYTSWKRYGDGSFMTDEKQPCDLSERVVVVGRDEEA